MSNSPVQVILNTNDFIQAWDRNPGGSNKDFFEGNDLEFLGHKENIQEQLESIKTIQVRNRFAPVTYAKVILRQSALAKSHRPTSQLFKPDIAPVIGAGDLGELFVELTPQSIDEIHQKVERAELKTRYKEKDGQQKANPSIYRSELGAIDEILPYTESDKRKFSVTEGLDWLKNSQSGGAYVVELFDTPPPQKDWDTLPNYKLLLFKSFVEGLKEFGNGLYASRFFEGVESSFIYGVKLEKTSDAPIIKLSASSSSAGKLEQNEIDLSIERHTKLLKFLGDHPLVKRINLPPLVTKSNSINSPEIDADFKVPDVIEDQVYPKICVVDGGVSDVFGEWIEARWGLLSSSDKDEDHGTFIAGLTIVGKALNGNDICKETDGCKIIDLDLLPKKGKYASYYTKPLEFFNELEDAVIALKEETGVRVFNFSLNFEQHASTSGYSLPAQILDRIAEENDIIFIMSAGNTTQAATRKEWPVDHFEALKILAGSRNDTIKTPAESSRNISVTALNPPNVQDTIPYALSNYSCRGPGLKAGLKPDLAHIGGSGTKDPSNGHGLFSLNSSGKIIDGCGTSYAAPNVSKTIASIDNEIEGMVSRETLIGLAIHHATLPSSLEDKNLRSVTKDLIGFGVPSASEAILEGDPSAITLVFANRIINRHKMSFRFTWPSSLVKDGKCIGQAKLTVVSTPNFDYKYGTEFVRVNIDGFLRQQDKNGSYKGRLKAIYTPDDGNSSLYEKDQIQHSFKWSPVKVYEKTFPKGVGPTTDWSLDIEYLARDGARIPQNGIPFTAILTISDPNKKEPVFNDMRQTLQSLGVNTVDIKTATRVVPRV
ncbi:S8 family peptidase [Croceitalea sp. P059]|uniref:S8 family peptidase n=1 Tax=Croceitalea sp. P059 TaxID=3075601 RepID=UPI0028839AF5|nr:S8 family peptidase [Croceitalea sp. P059]MDT0539755.1 S8 family peptidase [Croceitalea sp. P059]